MVKYIVFFYRLFSGLSLVSHQETEGCAVVGLGGGGLSAPWRERGGLREVR